MTQLCRKLGPDLGTSKVDLRYRPESTGGIHHAVMQESYMRLGLCNSLWFYTLRRMNLTKMTQLCRKLGPDLGTQKLTSATGQSPPVAFTMPSCKNRTCDSACATLIWFYTLWRMNLTKMTQLCRKLGPDLGTQSCPSQTDIIHWRHSPCRRASREPYMRLGTCISYSINTFWRMKHEQQDTGLPRPASSPCLPRDWAALTNDDIGGTPHMRFYNAFIKFLYFILSQYALFTSRLRFLW